MLLLKADKVGAQQNIKTTTVTFSHLNYTSISPSLHCTSARSIVMGKTDKMVRKVEKRKSKNLLEFLNVNQHLLSTFGVRFMKAMKLVWDDIIDRA